MTPGQFPVWDPPGLGIRFVLSTRRAFWGPVYTTCLFAPCLGASICPRHVQPPGDFTLALMLWPCGHACCLVHACLDPKRNILRTQASPGPLLNHTCQYYTLKRKHARMLLLCPAAHSPVPNPPTQERRSNMHCTAL